MPQPLKSRRQYTLRVILCDPQVLVRAGLRRLIEGLGGIEVVAETGDGQELLELIARHRPDIVLCEIYLPTVKGAEIAQQTRRHYPEVRVLICSGQQDLRNVRVVLKSGVAGFLAKDAEVPELELALRAVGKGQSYLSPSVSASALSNRRSVRAEDPIKLSARQNQVLQMIATGRTTKQIAGLLGISVKTVETHRARMMQVLKLYGTNALMRYALRQGLDVTD